MDNIFEPLDDDELEWLDHFLLYRIEEDADCEGKDVRMNIVINKRLRT